MNKIMHSKSGFTLVEVLIAIAVLGIFIIPVSGMFVSSLRTNESARAVVGAYAAANRVIESMEDHEIVPCLNLELNDSEYAQHRIDQSEYEVKKTIEITDNITMEGTIEPIVISENKKLLTIDASIDGEISFSDPNIPMIYPSYEQGVKFIRFGEEKEDDMELLINDESIYYINVIGGNNDIRLVLINNFDRDKVVYLTNMQTDGDFKVEAVSSSKAIWRIYDNMDGAQVADSGSIATADITIRVRHIPFNREYTVTTKRVFYKYEY